MHAQPRLLPTSVVGSYPQPDWLIDRAAARRRACRRASGRSSCGGSRAELLEQAQDDATRLAIATWSGPGSTSSRMASSGGRATRTDSRPRSRASTSTTPASRSTARATRTRCRGWSGRSRAAIRSRCGTSSCCARTSNRRIKITLPGPFTMTQQAQNDYYARPGGARACLRSRDQRGGARPEARPAPT